MNQYNVVYLDDTTFIYLADQKRLTYRSVPDLIVERVSDELRRLDPDLSDSSSLEERMIQIAENLNGRKFVFIIDEWDAVIREAKNDDLAQRAYLNLLRGWFKNANFTARAVAAAYMTGILPIRKDASQSAISDFREYTMLEPGAYAEYVGFTESEVRKICEKKNVDFSEMKRRYDGYAFQNVGSVYNPASVMRAVETQTFSSYWTQTSAADALLEYVGKDYSGLTKTVAELIGGVEVKVEPLGFANDLTTFRNKDDVLTLMIHLGYLTYDSTSQTTRIPNEEIRREFQRAVRDVNHAATIARLQESERLFLDTIQKNEAAVAAQIEKIHAEETAPLHDNSEESLRSVIKLAYYVYRDHYLKFEELPAGEGYADVVAVPLPN